MAFVTGQALPFVGTPTLNPSAISANNISVETFTVAGLNPDFATYAQAPSLEGGLFILDASCATVNVLTLSILNSTNGSVNPASQTFRVIQF